MKLAWQQERWANGAVVRTLAVADEADWRLFEHVAALLAAALPGQWVQRLDSADQRSWDLESGAGRLTLDLEPYTGIRLYASPDAPSGEAAARLLDRAHEILQSPARG